MKTESLEELVNLLQFEFPDLPVEVAERALIRSARAMACIKISQTRIEVPVFPCVNHYNIEHLLPEDMEVQCVEHVMWCGSCLEHIEPCHPCPYGYELLDNHNIVLHPGPSTGDETLELYLTLVPDCNACELPKDYTCRYQEPLLDRARSLIAEMPNQSWTNVPYSKMKKLEAMGKLNSLAAKLNSSGEAVASQNITTGECVV